MPCLCSDGSSEEPPSRVASDAADVNDDGEVNVVDVVSIPFFLARNRRSRTTRDSSMARRLRFRSPGVDPTHDGESVHADCLSYAASEPEATQDAVRHRTGRRATR